MSKTLVIATSVFVLAFTLNASAAEAGFLEDFARVFGLSGTDLGSGR